LENDGNNQKEISNQNAVRHWVVDKLFGDPYPQVGISYFVGIFCSAIGIALYLKGRSFIRTALIALGVFPPAIPWPIFPGATYVICQGFLNRVRAENSKSWPTVNGEVIVSDAAPAFIGLYIWFWWPLIRFRYVDNGPLYEKNSWQFGRSNFGSSRRAAKIASQFPVGTKVHVHFDPLDPEIALFDCGDDAARRGIWVGVWLLAAPFVLCLPIVWWNQ
jgi:hypothetical protein